MEPQTPIAPNLEIDYSGVVSSQSATGEASDWDPPVHKFFGKKLPSGKMEKEPPYVRTEYPSMMYGQTNGKIYAKVVNNDAERVALGPNWRDSPAAFGYIGAPSMQEHLRMRGHPTVTGLAGEQPKELVQSAGMMDAQGVAMGAERAEIEKERAANMKAAADLKAEREEFEASKAKSLAGMQAQTLHIKK